MPTRLLTPTKGQPAPTDGIRPGRWHPTTRRRVAKSPMRLLLSATSFAACMSVGSCVRDLVSRVVPGAVVLGSLYLKYARSASACCLSSSSTKAASFFPPDLSLPIEAAAILSARFVGMAIERLARLAFGAHATGDSKDLRWTREDFKAALSPKCDYSKFLEFCAAATHEEHLQYERFVVTTNAQANMAAALALSAAIAWNRWSIWEIFGASLLVWNAYSVRPGCYREEVVKREKARRLERAVARSAVPVVTSDVTP
jgi:hypothetical protein